MPRKSTAEKDKEWEEDAEAAEVTNGAPEKEKKSESGEVTLEDLPGVGPKGAEKLREAGYTDLMAIAAASAGEISAACEIGTVTAEKIIQSARSQLDMGFKSADEVLLRRKDVGKITTSSSALDALLGGGLETQAITEAFGAFASGKSQLAHQLAVNIQLPREKGGLNGKCVFIDTESSLPYDEKILVKSENGLELIEIGKLVESQIKEGHETGKISIHESTVSSHSNKELIKAVSFDPKDYKIKPFTITGFMKHKPQKVYKVKLTSGRHVKVTEYHNFFSLNENGQLSPKSTNALSVGDKICVAGNLPVEDSMDRINMSEILSEHKGLFVSGSEKFSEFLYKEKETVKNIAAMRNKNSDRAYNWLRRKKIPLDVFNEIKHKLNKGVLEELKIGGWSRRNNMPLLLNLDKDLMWLIGFYVAEGSCVRKDYGIYSVNRVIVTNTQNKLEKKVKEIGSRIGLKFSRSKADIKVDSKAFALLIKKLSLGDSAQEKRVPDFILKLNKGKIGAFLDGYIAGDGSLNSMTGTTNCETVSPYLAEGLMYSTLAVKIPSRNCTVLRKYNAKTGKPLKTINVHWQTSPLRSSRLEELPNQNCEIGILLKKSREKSDMSLRELAKKCDVNLSVIYEIESGKVKNVRRSTINKIINNLNKSEEFDALKKIIESDIWFDEVEKIEEVSMEPVYDIEVMPDGNEVQNFIGGYGGIILHNTFRPERIIQIAEAKGLDPKKVLKNIFVAKAYNSDHQIVLAEKAKDLVKEQNVKLIIIDSMTSHFRSDYSGRGELAPRQQKLNRHLHALQKLADSYNIAVYITNQVMANPAMMFGDPTTAVGGNIIGHASGFRLYLRKSKQTKRIARLVDSISLPEGEAVFNVTEKGVED